MVKNFCDVIIQTCFKDRFLFLLISLLLLLILHPILNSFVGISILMDVFTTTILISGVYAVSKKKHVLFTAVILAIPFFVSIWIDNFVEVPSLIMVGECFGILFFAFIVTVILTLIFREQEVTGNTIYAAIVVYLLIAVMWAFVFSILETIQPGSFAIGEGQLENGRDVFIYYSFVTITTLGYGDITPVTAPANAFSFLEAVIGQIYMIVLVARLVGLQIAYSMNRKSG
jgi:hypothetical protein